jgi:hypothetical protein
VPSFPTPPCSEPVTVPFREGVGSAKCLLSRGLAWALEGDCPSLDPTPNEAALAGINAEDKADPAIYPPAEVMAKLQFLEDVGDATRLYDEVWTSVKAR